MRVREPKPITVPQDFGRPLAVQPPRSRMRSAIGAMFGIPLLVLVAMATLVVLEEHPIPAPEQHIELRMVGGGTGTALVLGGGTGIHLVRVSSSGVPLVADLSGGRLRIMSLRTIQLRASGVSGKAVVLTAEGHALSLRDDSDGVSIRTGM